MWSIPLADASAPWWAPIMVAGFVALFGGMFLAMIWYTVHSIKSDEKPIAEAQATETALKIAASGIAAIRAHDPQFDRAGFLNRVQDAFIAILTAVTSNDPDNARPYMSQTYFVIWSKGVAGAGGKHHGFTNLRVLGTEFVSAGSTASYDSVTAKITAKADVAVVDAASGRATHTMTDHEFSEVWMFQRSATAVTRTNPGVLELRCPNCGAPLELTAEGACHYCGADVSTGAVDWVLANIDSSEFGV